MSFGNESFWVVAGTAAPVIALAAVISVNEVARTEATVDKLSIRALSAADLDETDWHYQWFNTRSWKLEALRVAQLLSLCLQAGLLAVSMLSLAFERNLIPIWICVAAPTAGVLLLAYAGLFVTRSQELARTYEGSVEAKEAAQRTMKLIRQAEKDSELTDSPPTDSATGTGSQSCQPTEAPGDDG